MQRGPQYKLHTSQASNYPLEYTLIITRVRSILRSWRLYQKIPALAQGLSQGLSACLPGPAPSSPRRAQSVPTSASLAASGSPVAAGVRTESCLRSRRRRLAIPALGADLFREESIGAVLVAVIMVHLPLGVGGARTPACVERGSVSCAERQRRNGGLTLAAFGTDFIREEAVCKV